MWAYTGRVGLLTPTMELYRILLESAMYMPKIVSTRTDQKLMVEYAMNLVGKISPLLEEGWKIIPEGTRVIGNGDNPNHSMVLVVLQKTVSVN